MDKTNEFLDLARKASINHGFTESLINIWKEDEEFYGIEVDDIYWGNAYTPNEIETAIYALFKGIELGKKKQKND